MAPRVVQWIFKDWWLKIVAILAAVLLWAIARLEREYTRELELRLDTSLLPPEYMVVEQNVEKVRAEITAKGRYLIRLRSYDPKIILPLSDMKEGRERLRIGPENVNLPKEIQVRALDPYQIELKIGKRYKRKVPVIIRMKDGTMPAEHFAISAVEHEQTVEVYGTKEVISNLNHLFCEPLDVEGASKDFSKLLAIQVPDTPGLVVKPSSLLVKVRVEPETTVVLGGLAVVLKGKPLEGQAYLLNKEAELTLRGPVSLLRGFQPSSVEVSISVASLTRGDYQLPAEVSLPPQVKVDRSEPGVFRVMVR